jgi:tRNA threonylcarbamoyladenosine modification (KEOPS) complex Cgi121 subunit
MEVMLYASGERQITKAKRKMGVHQGTERVAVVLLSLEGDMDLVLERLGLERDDSLLDCTLEKGEAFGLDPLELGTLGPGYLQELVLEKVAFVDLLKR